MVSTSAWVRVAAALVAVGWGANQFAAMLLVYRGEDGLTESKVSLLFAAYVIGLVPALLGAAWLATRVGNRPLLRSSLILAAIATLLLILGADFPWALYPGRILAGAATGAAMGPGTAWIKELSAAAPAGSGARRATIALSLGFGGGPLVAGVVAEFAPAPQITPYIAHLVGMVCGAALAWAAPEPRRVAQAAPSIVTVARTLNHAWFIWRVVPAAPWVFGAAALSLVYLPGRLAGGIEGPATLITGLVAAGTLFTGVAVQGPVRHLEGRRPGVSTGVGLLLLLVALGLAALALALPQPWLMLVTAPTFGAAYGTLMVAGLTDVERHVPLPLLAPCAAVFYCLTYIGFFLPWLLSLSTIPSPALLGGCAVLVVIGVAVVVSTPRPELPAT